MNLVIMSIMEKLRLIMYFPAVRLIWTTIKNMSIKTGDVTFAKMETDMELRITEQKPIVFVALVLKIKKSFFFIKR